MYVSELHSSSTPGVFYTYFYNHGRLFRLEKLLYLELSKSPNRFFKPLLDPGYVQQKSPSGCNSYTTKANGFILEMG